MKSKEDRYQRLIAESIRQGDCLICLLTPSQVYADIKGFGKAHRFVYERNHGPVPKRMMVCHSCDTPKCIEDKHLFLGTALDNMLDKVVKNRQHHGGPPKKLTSDEVREASNLYDMGYTYQEIGETYNVSRRTIQRELSSFSISSGNDNSVCVG